MKISNHMLKMFPVLYPINDKTNSTKSRKTQHVHRRATAKMTTGMVINNNYRRLKEPGLTTLKPEKFADT